MATYKICKHCKEFAEFKKAVRFEFGNEHVEYICSNCGIADKTTISHVHYGNDALKK